MKSQLRVKGIVLVTIGAMLWGISGTVAQYLFQNKDFSAEWLVVIRLLASGILLLLYSAVKDKQNIFEIWKSRYDSLSLIFFSVIGMVGVQYTYFAAIKYGNAATATILQYLSPVIITCYLAIRTKKIPNIQEIIAIVLAMLGTFLIITKGNIYSISISKLALFWGISSAFAAAFYTLQPCSLLAKWGSTLVVGWGMLIGGIAFSFIHQPWNFTGQWSISSILSVIFVVLFGTLIAFTCYLESLKYIKPTEASVLSSVEPLSAAFLSVLWLHNPLDITQWLGTACIIVTIIILSHAKIRKREERKFIMKDFYIRLLRLIWGLFLYALGIVVTINAHIGYAPWDVLHVGFAKTIGISIGNASIIAGLIVVIIAVLLGEKLGLGTILNMIVIGVFIDVILGINVIPVMNSLIPGIIMLITGLFIISFASYFYIDSGFGAGPRDSLMVALTRKTGLAVGTCRGIIELSAVFAGWCLGGMLGIGTIISAFAVGFCVQITFKFLKFDATKVKHETLNQTYKMLLGIDKQCEN